VFFFFFFFLCQIGELHVPNQFPNICELRNPVPRLPPPP
jgi:hypothetical protein